MTGMMNLVVFPAFPALLSRMMRRFPTPLQGTILTLERKIGLCFDGSKFGQT
jgi:hypothetical protein